MPCALRLQSWQILKARSLMQPGKALQLELGHFATLQDAALIHTTAIQLISQSLSQLDVSSALAELAEEQGYVNRSLMTAGVSKLSKGGTRWWNKVCANRRPIRLLQMIAI